MAEKKLHWRRKQKVDEMKVEMENGKTLEELLDIFFHGKVTEKDKFLKDELVVAEFTKEQLVKLEYQLQLNIEIPSQNEEKEEESEEKKKEDSTKENEVELEETEEEETDVSVDAEKYIPTNADNTILSDKTDLLQMIKELQEQMKDRDKQIFAIMNYIEEDKEQKQLLLEEKKATEELIIPLEFMKMKNSQRSIRINQDIYEKFSELCKEKEITTSSALNFIIQKFIDELN